MYNRRALREKSIRGPRIVKEIATSHGTILIIRYRHTRDVKGAVRQGEAKHQEKDKTIVKKGILLNFARVRGQLHLCVFAQAFLPCSIHRKIIVKDLQHFVTIYWLILFGES